MTTSSVVIPIVELTVNTTRLDITTTSQIRMSEGVRASYSQVCDVTGIVSYRTLFGHFGSTHGQSEGERRAQTLTIQHRRNNSISICKSMLQSSCDFAKESTDLQWFCSFQCRVQPGSGAVILVISILFCAT